jgi:DNA-directed RNA polymerase specialized sigma24 family protein
MHIEDSDMRREISDAVALERLAQGLESMPEWPRAVFVRLRFDDATYGEIAAESGISIAKVERYVAAAMAHLHRAVYGDE